LQAIFERISMRHL